MLIRKVLHDPSNTRRTDIKMYSSMQAPKISVVMAVYGNWDDLEATLESVLRQTCSDYELILVDDGNPEPGKTVIRTLTESDPRIRLLVNEQNQGLTFSLIRGCEAARGEFIARIDCGDLMVPESRLEWQSSRMQAEALALSGGGIEIWDFLNKKRWRTRLRRRTHDEIVSAPRFISWLSHPTVMFRKDVYLRAGGYSADMKVGQDTDLWPRIADHGGLAVLPKVFAVGTFNTQSISVANNTRQIRTKIKRIERQYAISPQRGSRLGAWARLQMLLFRERLKLLIPLRYRLNLRYRASMDFIERIPDEIRTVRDVAECLRDRKWRFKG